MFLPCIIFAAFCNKFVLGVSIGGLVTLKVQSTKTIILHVILS